MFNFDWFTILIPRSWRAAVYEAIAFISLSTMLSRLQFIFFESNPGSSLLVIAICLPIGIFCIVQFLRLQIRKSDYSSLDVLNQHYKDEQVRQTPIKPWNMESPDPESQQNRDNKSN
jgi:hypothetical protein